MLLLNASPAHTATSLAVDEALLLAAERDAVEGEVLRLWEFAAPCVVLGRGGRVAEEVYIEVCRAEGIDLLRRTSGGGTVVGGPGCLMYSLVLSRRKRPELSSISFVTTYVLLRVQYALESIGVAAHMAGTSDLCSADGKKFSGNSLRIRPEHILFHGTLLYDFDLSLVERLLRMPPRQPDYRRNRPHAAFVTNVTVPAHALRQALATAWNATNELTDWPRDLTNQLVAEKYDRDEWNLRH